MEYARHDAIMQTPHEKGGSQRTHLEALARGGHAKAQVLLEPPPFPEELGYLWDRFQTLDRMRGYTEHGPSALTALEIDAANRMLRWELAPHEVEALHAMDIVTRFPNHPGT